MELLSSRLNFSAKAEALPDGLLQAAHAASRENMPPEEAKQTFERFAPALGQYRAHPEFAVACGMLIEKQRLVDGMLDFWSDLRRVFPDEVTTLRMMMRWYRRTRNADEGVAQIHQLFPLAHTDLSQAETAVVGLSELKAFADVDGLMDVILPLFPQARQLRMRYIKILSEQSRYLEAKAVADTVADQAKMGTSSRKLLDTVQRRAEKLSQLLTRDATDVIPEIVRRLPILLSQSSKQLGQISFFSGQLGTGGAERQMTRIAGIFQDRYIKKDPLFVGQTDVCVRHATAASGSDYFLPDLKRAGVATTILTEIPVPERVDFTNVSPQISNLLELLPEDIFEHTLKLVPYYQQRRTSVAYLWQDGGVLSAGLAALLAGVPRIVTSFRGLPPNLRPNLFRPELEPLYRSLAHIPHVTFTSNSRSAAVAYEDWLSLRPNSVAVIPNAIPPVSSGGNDQDLDDWDRVVSRSVDCTKTVLGVFRFDENKRPLFWIECAARYATKNPDTRFVIVGTGYLMAAAKTLIRDLNMEDQIFLVGLRKNVGFYLHRADLMMHLARMEGLPNVIIEAHLAALPTVATPAGGTDEVIAQDISGHILTRSDDPDPAEIDAALTALLQNEPRLRRMGHIARHRARKRYLPEQVVRATTELLLQH